MKQKVLINVMYKQEEKLLTENEIAVNLQAKSILLIIGIVFVPLVFLLRYFGFFLFTIEEGFVPLVITALVLVLPALVGRFNCYTKEWFKYIIVMSVTLCIPSIYIAFDYMMLMLWIMPILTSCLYFNKRFNFFSLFFTILVLGLTSYYRSYLRFVDGLIDARVGGLFKDFLVSFTTYTLITCILFIFIYCITKKTNFLLYEMIVSKKYQRMSIVDGLTGIFNYRYLMAAIEKNKLEYDRVGTIFTIIVFDVDNFKKINDTYGHLIGDQALIQICACLKDNIRENDILGRYGGEEFMILFPNTTSEDAYLIAERCRKAVSAISLENLELQLTVSGGISQYNGGIITDLIHIADMRMYFAKESGRNKVETQYMQDCGAF